MNDIILLARTFWMVAVPVVIPLLVWAVREIVRPPDSKDENL